MFITIYVFYPEEIMRNNNFNEADKKIILKYCKYLEYQYFLQNGCKYIDYERNSDLDVYDYFIGIWNGTIVDYGKKLEEKYKNLSIGKFPTVNLTDNMQFINELRKERADLRDENKEINKVNLKIKKFQNNKGNIQKFKYD